MSERDARARMRTRTLCSPVLHTALGLGSGDHSQPPCLCLIPPSPRTLTRFALPPSPSPLLLPLALTSSPSPSSPVHLSVPAYLPRVNLSTALFRHSANSPPMRREETKHTRFVTYRRESGAAFAVRSSLFALFAVRGSLSAVRCRRRAIELAEPAIRHLLLQIPEFPFQFRVSRCHRMDHDPVQSLNVQLFRIDLFCLVLFHIS